ncbi:DUF1254 domain-containing protein [Deminuibacter soli]|uniref:DUF1254 domain-containing protein n=1 Tax=Deminuibacter soli TaxID=2291815 RepID=A0A3E1NG00_9BACT|nr:DUF1254 domain-containing protein [Deminuibacter soli]RFM26896.1 DUF1254 domain-containing protein [Deminuibacter soli]
MKRTIFYLAMIVAVTCSCGSNRAPGDANNMADTSLTAAKVQQMAREAYVHCFPIFENYKGIYFYGVLQTSPKYAPMNTITKETKLYSPDDKLVVSPNNDTYYSTGILDVRAAPVIIKVPESKNRYYVIQLVDMVTNNFAYIGVNTTGTAPGIYAVTGPDFTGRLPDSVKEIKSPSGFLVFAGRTAVNAENQADIAKAKQLQELYQVGPVSKFFPGFPSQKADTPNFPPIKKQTIPMNSFLTE